MATILAFNKDIENQPRRGLLARIASIKDNLSEAVASKINKETLAVAAEKLTNATKTAGNFLRDGVTQSIDRVRNMSASDWKWVGASVGAGIVAKVGVFAALGVASGGTVTAALIGGAVVGLTRSAINHVRDSRAISSSGEAVALSVGKTGPIRAANHFFSTKTLMNTASSAAISAATFGVLSGVEHFSGINIAEKINHGLSRSFNWAVDRVTETSWWQSFANREVERILAEGYDLSHSLNTRSGKIKFDAPFDASKHTATSGANQNIDNATREAALAKVRAWEATQAKAAPAAPVAAPSAPVAAAPTIVEGNTLAESAIGDDADMTVPRDMPNIPIPDPSKPVEIEIKTADGETTIIKAPAMPNMSAEYAIAEKALHDDYIIERLRGDIHGLTGKPAAPDMTVEDMAKVVMPRNPDSYLRVLAQEAAEKAVRLDPTKMAAACVTDLPKTAENLAQQGHILPNTCAIAKGMEDMAEGDYVLVRDAAEPAPTTKRGLRALFKQAIEGATGQLKEKTATFIDKVVAGHEIPDMAQQKFEETATAAADRHQILALAPNP